MKVRQLLSAAALLASSAVLAADPCEQIVADTVAELRAGADARWSAEMERAVRSAAGSACVKARSDRYGEGGVAGVTGDNVVAVPAAGPVPAATTAVAAEGSASSATDAETAREGSEGSEGDEGFSLGGLTIRGASGSPSKKSYERTREVLEEE